MSRNTTPIAAITGGNRLFDCALASLGLADDFSRTVLGDVFRHIGSSPMEATADELGVMLPEIERRMRLALPYDAAAAALGKLRHLLLSWEE